MREARSSRNQESSLSLQQAQVLRIVRPSMLNVSNPFINKQIESVIAP